MVEGLRDGELTKAGRMRGSTQGTEWSPPTLESSAVARAPRAVFAAGAGGVGLGDIWAETTAASRRLIAVHTAAPEAAGSGRCGRGGATGRSMRQLVRR